MTFFSLKQAPYKKSKLAWSFRWLLVLTLVPLTLLMTLLSACSESPTYTTMNNLYGVAAVSPTDIWAVGNMTSSETSFQGQILIEHWNGRQWQTVPASLDGTGSLVAIAAIASNDIWAVGTSSVSFGALLTMHWDGARWSQIKISDSIPAWNTSLSAVVAVSSNDVWAAGQQQNLPIIQHWNGQTWHHATLPTLPDFRFGGFNAIQAISATDIWAAGWYEKPESSATYTLVEHWNGKNWQLVPTPQIVGRSCLCDAQFSNLTAFSSNNVWAVGATNINVGGVLSETIFEHWNGTKWEVVATSALAETNKVYHNKKPAIFAANAQDIWITGYQSSNSSTTNSPSLLHWNGQSWQLVTLPAIKDFFCDFYAGTALASDDLWVVGSCGGRASAPTPEDSTAQTLVDHWDGTHWTHIASPSPGQPAMIPGG